MEPSINLRDLEAQEQNSEPLNEYLNMDNDTIIKMLLASQNENEKLHARLDKIYVEVKDRPRYNIEKVTWNRKISL